jgi:hypothetical protein
LKRILVTITFYNNKRCGVVDIGQWGIESNTRIGRDWEASTPAMGLLYTISFGI